MHTIRNILQSGLSRRLVLWFLALSLVPLAVAGVFAYLISEEALRMAAFEKLQTVATGRQHSIEVLEEVRLQQVRDCKPGAGAGYPEGFFARSG